VGHYQFLSFSTRKLQLSHVQPGTTSPSVFIIWQYLSSVTPLIERYKKVLTIWNRVTFCTRYRIPIGEMLTAAEIAEHSNRQSCWIVIEGRAYDVTDFLDSHPGGAAIILRHAGKVCVPRIWPLTLVKAL
jgi:hypothetical protein